MIKSVSLLTRKVDMTHDEFIDKWVNEHAPLARAVPGLKRYVLSFVNAQPIRPDIARHGIEVDGIAELWYEDAQAMRHAVASAEMKVLRDHGATIIAHRELHH